MPRFLKPTLVTKQVTAQTLESALSSLRSAHGTRLFRTSPGYAHRGSTAQQPTGSPPRYASGPVVAPSSR